MLTVLDEKTNEIDLKRYVRVEKIPGGELSDCRVIRGVMLNKDVTHASMRRRIEHPRIILLDCSLEYVKAESVASLEIHEAEAWDRALKQEEEAVKEMCDAILAFKPDLVITEKGISDLAQHYLQNLFAQPESTFSLSEALDSTLRQIIDFDSLNAVFSSIVNVVISSVIAIFSISFITFFFLKDDGLFYAMVTAMFPERYHDNITRALDSVTYLLSRYFTGILTESLLLMIAVMLVMIAFGMPTSDAAFIGLTMGVMNVVPYAGPLIGGIVSVFVGIISPIEGMTVGHTVFVIAGSLLILKGMDDFVLQPTLYSERVKAHPLEVFLVILIAGSLAGILGMLLAIPSYTVLRVFAKEFFSQFSLVRKLTEKI